MRSQQLAVHSLQLPFEKTFSMGTFRDLIVYKKAFQLAMEVFEMTQNFQLKKDIL